MVFLNAHNVRQLIKIVLEGQLMEYKNHLFDSVSVVQNTTFSVNIRDKEIIVQIDSVDDGEEALWCSLRNQESNAKRQIEDAQKRPNYNKVNIFLQITSVLSKFFAQIL